MKTHNSDYIGCENLKFPSSLSNTNSITKIEKIEDLHQNKQKTTPSDFKTIDSNSRTRPESVSAHVATLP